MGQKKLAVAAFRAKKAVQDALALREANGREWKERASQSNPSALSADGYDSCIVGIAERCGQPTLLVYDYESCVQLHAIRDGWTREEAQEWLDFNVTGAWLGEGTPIFLYSQL